MTHKVRYTRRFKPGDRGPDVEGVGRALSRAGYGAKLPIFNLLPKRIRQTWGFRKRAALKKFKRKHHLSHDSVYGERAHAALTPFFDSKARKLMQSYRKPVPLDIRKWNKMLAYMKAMNIRTRGYSYGAGHGIWLSRLDPDDAYDCSSSTSKVLFEGDMWHGEYALTSGEIAAHYGEPGRGKYFTVYAHSGHAWIRLHRSRWWRFDTSPYGFGDRRSGPRLRYLPRPTWGFTARHWPGM